MWTRRAGWLVAWATGVLATLSLAAIAVAQSSADSGVEGETTEGEPSVRLLDVPFVPQSEALCGGASAAMVLRYWGEERVDASSFEPLVHEGAGGISAAALGESVRERGFRAIELGGDASTIRGQIDAGRPVIALINMGAVSDSAVDHYVVLVGWQAGQVVFHDPAIAPFQTLNETAFIERWNETDRFALLVLPGESNPATPLRQTNPTTETPSDSYCTALVSKGVAHAQSGEWATAERIFFEAQLLCPSSSEPFRELAGMRLLQSRSGEAAKLAEKAVERNADDALAWKILATARFLGDDTIGALTAWNKIGDPELDLVRIDGLERLAHSEIADWLNLPLGAPLTSEAFARAHRRLDSFPALSGSSLNYHPRGGGLGEITVEVAERSNTPSGADLLAHSVEALAERRLSFDLANVFGGGELWSAEWRFWEGRPHVAVGVSVPGLGPIPGTVRFEATWQRQRYAITESTQADGATRFTQSEQSVSMSIDDWARSDLRWQLGVGLSQWDGRGASLNAAGPHPHRLSLRDSLGSPSARSEGSYGFLSGAIEKRAWEDRLAANASVSAWLGPATRFATSSVSVNIRTSKRPRGLVTLARAGFETASMDAPITLWSAAGVGHSGFPPRPPGPLLRAHPLFEDGSLNTDRLSRRLLHAGAEVEAWLDHWGPVHFGAAAFLDTAKPWLPTTEASNAQMLVDVGVGLRMHVSGQGTLRLDYGRGMRDGASAISMGWQKTWSRP